MLEEKFLIKNLDELGEFCSSRLKNLVRNSGSANLAILFFAEMGAGKTTLIREFAKVLGIEENVTSPTFVGMNEYHFNNLNFYHFDLYQVGLGLEDLSELLSDAGKNILVFEWAEKLEKKLLDYLARNSTVIKIAIKVLADEIREVTINF